MELKIFLVNSLITFFIKGNPVFNNGQWSLPRNPPNCIVLDNWVFDRLVLTGELFAKALWRFTSCWSVNNLCGNLVSSLELPIILDDNLKTTSVSFFYCRL